MSTPTAPRLIHNLFASPSQKAAIYVILAAGTILQATLTTGPLNVLTTHPTIIFILSTVTITASTFGAFLTGRTWYTRPHTTLLGASTALLCTIPILAVAATPYLYAKTLTGYTGYTFLESLTWRTDYTTLVIHTLFTLGTITLAALAGHHTTRKSKWNHPTTLHTPK